MSEDCAACQSIAPGDSRWKGVALVVGAIFFCPCHLPVTMGLLAGLGGTAWLLGSKLAVYAVFAILYAVVLFFGLRWVMRNRDRERRLEQLHTQHAPAPPRKP